MAIDPISFGMLGVSGFSALNSYAAGAEAKRSYEQQAAEVERQTAYAQRLALEEQKEIAREGRSAESKAVASAGASGLRTGGSVVTLTQAINAKVERRKAMVGMQFNEEARRNAFTASQYRTAGANAKRAGTVEAFGSLLTGGLDLAMRKEKRGFGTWGKTFFTGGR